MKKRLYIGCKHSCELDLEDEAFLKISSVLESGQVLAIACSGGADSVLLLHLLLAAFPQRKNQMKVLHFNHKARQNADKDEAFVRKLCADMGVDFICGKPDKAPKKFSEDIFRRMRLGFFKESYFGMGLSCIAQGHNADDLCETILMRLMRGVGIAGLSAPRPVSVVGGAVFARPILRLKKADIRRLLEEAKLEWREDESNEQPVFLRNRVRLGILGKMQEISPADFYASAARVRRLAQEDSDFIENLFLGQISKLNPDIFSTSCTLATGAKAGKLALSAHIVSQRSLFRRAVNLLLSRLGRAEMLRSAGVDDFINKAPLSRKIFKASVGEGFLEWNPETLTLGFSATSGNSDESSFGCVLPLDGTRVCLPGGMAVSAKRVRLETGLFGRILRGENDDTHSAYVDARAAKDGFVAVRPRAAGDEYAPIGASSARPLRRLLSDRKVPLSMRASLPVFYNSGGEILWVPGVAPSKIYALENSPDAIELTFAGK